MTSASQNYEHFIIGSPHLTKVFCNQKPLSNLWARKRRLSSRFFRCQMIVAQSFNLQIFWNSGNNWALADLLIRNVSLKELNGHRLAPKEIPKDVRFFNQSRHDVQYLIDHNSLVGIGKGGLYPIVCTHLVEEKQKRVTLEKMVLTWWIKFYTQCHLKLILLFSIFSAKARTLTFYENDKLH